MPYSLHHGDCLEVLRSLPDNSVDAVVTGSGSTGKAAILEGFSFIGIERESEYLEIARARIDAVSNQPKQQDLF